LLLQQVRAGLANGAIYMLVAFAVVTIYQAIDHFNFAQDMQPLPRPRRSCHDAISVWSRYIIPRKCSRTGVVEIASSAKAACQ
jgi:hypothetical protein